MRKLFLFSVFVVFSLQCRTQSREKSLPKSSSPKQAVSEIASEEKQDFVTDIQDLSSNYLDEVKKGPIKSEYPVLQEIAEFAQDDGNKEQLGQLVDAMLDDDVVQGIEEDIGTGEDAVAEGESGTDTTSPKKKKQGFAGFVESTGAAVLLVGMTAVLAGGVLAFRGWKERERYKLQYDAKKVEMETLFKVASLNNLHQTGKWTTSVEDLSKQTMDLFTGDWLARQGNLKNKGIPNKQKVLALDVEARLAYLRMTMDSLRIDGVSSLEGKYLQDLQEIVSKTDEEINKSVTVQESKPYELRRSLVNSDPDFKFLFEEFALGKELSKSPLEIPQNSNVETRFRNADLSELSSSGTDVIIQMEEEAPKNHLEDLQKFRNDFSRFEFDTPRSSGSAFDQAKLKQYKIGAITAGAGAGAVLVGGIAYAIANSLNSSDKMQLAGTCSGNPEERYICGLGRVFQRIRASR